ncbi:MAG: NAD-dependent epimerase/dehydratase family protein, partial [Anaerolineae bacterium]
ILANHAINTGKIKVFGGEQLRPNIHIQDMVDLYLLLLELPAAQIAGKIFNAGFENHRVRELAQMVQTIVGFDRVAIETVPTDDNRSYHVSSAKIAAELGFVPQHTIEEAVRDLVAAFRAGKLPDSMTAPRYFNIKMMQAINLQ